MSRKRGSYTLAAGLAAQVAPYAKAYAAAQAERLIAAGARRASRYVKSRYGGSYSAGGVVTNSLYTDRGISNEIAQMHTVGDETGALIIEHKEYIQDIVGSTNAFNNTLFQINAGNTYLFPWMSQIALNYTEYEFISLEFIFKSTLSDTTTTSNGQLGTVIMCTNYNVNDPAFSNKTKMMEYYGDNSAKATLSQRHGVECDPTKNAGPQTLLIGLDGTVPTGREPSLYNLGNFQIATSNLASNVQCGELWVQYTVRLMKPRQYTASGLSIAFDQFYTASSAILAALTPTPLVKVVANTANNNIRGTLFNGAVNFNTLKIVAAANKITYQFPFGAIEGTYKVNLKYVGNYTATLNNACWITLDQTDATVQGGGLTTDYPCFAILAKSESTVDATIQSIQASKLPNLAVTADTDTVFIADFDVTISQPNQPRMPASGASFVAPQGPVIQMSLNTAITFKTGGFFFSVTQINPGQLASTYSTTI